MIAALAGLSCAAITVGVRRRPVLPRSAGLAARPITRDAGLRRFRIRGIDVPEYWLATCGDWRPEPACAIY